MPQHKEVDFEQLGQCWPCTNAGEWQSAPIDPNVDNGVPLKADIIEELVDMMGLPKEGTLATVERYTELAAKGVDEDFHKAPFGFTAVDGARSTPANSQVGCSRP